MIEPIVRAALADPATKELVVVVDGCRDGTYELLCELAADDQRLRPFWQQNAGESRARQAGVELAGEAVVVLLDDDVRAEPGLIAGHVSRHRAGERQVVLGYMPVTSSEHWPDWLTGTVYGAAYERRCLRYESDPRAVLATLWAGNMSLRRTDALEVGLAGPNLKFHADRELGLRLLKAGFVGTFDRSLRATHLYSRSFEGFCADAREGGRGLWLLHQLHNDVLGDFSTEKLLQALSVPERALLRRAADAPGLVAVGVLSRAVPLLAQLGAHKAAIRVAGWLSLLLRQRGALEALRAAKQR